MPFGRLTDETQATRPTDVSHLESEGQATGTGSSGHRAACDSGARELQTPAYGPAGRGPSPGQRAAARRQVSK